MGKPFKRWSKEEENLLIKHVKQNVQNLTEAFREVSKLTGRSEKAVMLHWYTISRYKTSSSCFVILSKFKGIKNRKIVLNTSKENYISFTEKMFNFILKLLKLK